MNKILPIAFLALAATGLHAEKMEIRGGLLGGLTFPLGDLKSEKGYGTNKSLGYHIGGHVDFGLDTNNEVRVHLTYTDLPASAWTHPYYEVRRESKFAITQIGADWLYHFDNTDQGMYTVLGASWSKFKQKTKNIFWDGTDSFSATQNKMALRGGLGYNFNPMFGVEATYNHASVKDGLLYTEPNSGFKVVSEGGFGFTQATWIGLSAVVRFGGGK